MAVSIKPAQSVAVRIESGELRPVFIMSVRVRVSSIGLGEEGSSIGYYYLLLSYY
jgi:hypothetical protein